jgi:ubiquitin-like modifier-activating enzyme ATG7
MASSPPVPCSPVKFVPFASTVDSPFWVEYCHLKLETIQLSEAAIDIHASYTAREPRLQCVQASLTNSNSNNNNNNNNHNDRVACRGMLLGFNTLEAFQNVDKNQLLRDAFVQDFANGSVSSLTRFQLLTFADLKNHKVLYWFGFPALLCQTIIQASVIGKEEQLEDWSLSQQFHGLRQRCLSTTTDYNGLPPFFVSTKDQMEFLSQDVLEILNVTQTGSGTATSLDHVVFGFVDPSSSSTSSSTSSTGPPIIGWPLRNLIAYLVVHLNLGGQTVNIVSYRPSKLRRIAIDTEYDPEDGNTNDESSMLLHVTIPNKQDYLYDNDDDDDNDSHSNYKVVGWELNARHKPGPRWVNLKPLLDSTHLAVQAADLNLKLMKWRMIPTLDVDMLQRDTKVLLIGAGTLGCSVARTLLGWGIRHFTILDYGTVSYSNPVRQNLFTLEDCHFNNGAGKPKAQAMADALKTIAADVHAEGIHLSIPMPGHASETKESIQTSVQTLDRLVQDCDVVYLLTDTRESRWLPTLMAAAHDKILINAALGLDSWLVMRHGGGILPSSTTTTTTTTDQRPQPNPQQEQARLGCYFCNDVVAPENSTKNRTLDQQCTVTRPGLAPIAASMAVELMVSVLHHPAKQRAPAPKRQTNVYSPTNKDGDDDSSSSPLGIMPHQIRGSLVSYTMMTPTVPAFSCCTACSASTMEAYHANKLDLVYQVCQSTGGSLLEDLSGLSAFRAEAAEKMAGMEDWDEDEMD